MELSSQDSLRLHVLLKQPVEAIRINESNLTLHALLEAGETTIKLNPNCAEHRYLRLVRECLSGHALGSPEGYPVFLNRWRRMDETTSEKLEALLLLAEPEAVIAAAHSRQLTEALARRIWWSMPSAEIARTLLRHPEVAASDVARMLADFLVEFLPFEQEPRDAIANVAALLQAGVLQEEEILSLWRKAEKQVVLYLGFMQACPDQLPTDHDNDPSLDETGPTMPAELEIDNALAALIRRLHTPSGRAFSTALLKVIHGLPDQDTTVMLIQILENYFALDPVCDEELSAILRHAPELEAKARACLALRQTNEAMLDPIFSQTDAIGSLMRRKLQPVLAPVIENLSLLLE